MRIKTAALALLLAATTAPAEPHITHSATATPRELFAVQRLEQAVKNLPGKEQILIATRMDPLLKPYDHQIPAFPPEVKEAFSLHRIGSTIIVAGSDSSGALYGALELAARIHTAHAIPATLDYQDHPQLKIRGTALGIQKPEITYDGAEYDYRLMPDEFPWFYDKTAWTRYLDTLVEERYNALFLWNGHPFTSLLKLPKYPEAQEVPTAQREKNLEM